MSEWLSTTLGASGKWLSGGTPNTTEPSYWNGEIPWISASSMHSFAICDSERRVTQLGVENGTRVVPDNTIIFIVRGMSLQTEFRVGITKRPVAFGQDCKAIIPNETFEPLFLAYFLRSQQYEVLGLVDEASHGTGKLPTEAISALEVPLPSKREQRAIAEVLSSLDNKIDLLNRQNRTLEAMAETLFRQWFVEEPTELVQIIHYVDFNPSRKLPKGTIAPYLDMAGVSTSTFCPSGWYDREFTSGTKFSNGDTLLARITPCLENGKSAYVTFLEKQQVGWGSTEFIVMRSRGELTPFFTYALARNEEFREYAEGCMAGSSGRQRVDVEHLKKFEIGLIPGEAISEFNLLVDAIPPKLHSNMKQIHTLEKLRDTLLPKLMSGEVRVNYE